jgi:hypothetical protein
MHVDWLPWLPAGHHTNSPPLTRRQFALDSRTAFRKWQDAVLAVRPLCLQITDPWTLCEGTREKKKIVLASAPSWKLPVDGLPFGHAYRAVAMYIGHWWRTGRAWSCLICSMVLMVTSLAYLRSASWFAPLHWALACHDQRTWLVNLSFRSHASGWGIRF